MHKISYYILFVGFLVAIISCSDSKGVLTPEKSDRIAIIGGNIGSRMMNYGYFETEIFTRFPEHDLFVRNMADGGDQMGFRPHSGRNEPWAFPGAEQFYDELAQPSGSIGHLETPDQWLNRLNINTIIGMFGYSESFNGPEGVENFKNEMSAFIDYTLSQKYNESQAPTLVMVSPIAFQDLSAEIDLPDGKKENKNLELYSEAMKEICKLKNIPFVDAYGKTSKWFGGGERLTIDGFQLNDKGYQKFSKFLADEIFGGSDQSTNQQLILEAVNEKNWFWHNDFKIPNGVHTFGRRYDPFGPDNYPYEFEKIRQMTANRDTAIWMALRGEKADLTAMDARTRPLPEVATNYYERGGEDEPGYLYGDEALSKFKMAPGFKVELFASEKEFNDLANPVQLSFDNKGRLWVAVMPSYPHYKPGDARPDDKIIILEDTDNDGKADKQTTFLDNIHLPIGFEIAPEGVYVSQGTNLKIYRDTDGDDKADEEEILLSGFDDHDTHHAISAFCADPSGAIYMAEGVFLHTNVETPYGTVRATNGGFYRYNPTRQHLERTTQIPIPNPWGIAFDEWGQNFFLETSGPALRWMMPGSINPRYGISNHKSAQLIEDDHLVRPTSGLEFVTGDHFPPHMQGDLLLGNAIGFLGIKQHSISDDGTGYKTAHRQDLIQSSDPNFRPVDLEFAPDGSLYVVDWHNILIGHMQHNARDPLRDHSHGRIYRITYPERPLNQIVKIDGAPIKDLLQNLKSNDYRVRYRTKRELRGRDSGEVLGSMTSWIDELDNSSKNYDRNLLEGLWVVWGQNAIDQNILEMAINSANPKVRSAVVRMIRYNGHLLPDQAELLRKLAGDDNSRVRLEAIVAASWLDEENGLSVLAEAGKKPLDEWMVSPFSTSQAHLQGQSLKSDKRESVTTALTGEQRDFFMEGKDQYEKDGYCGTCHQANGRGLKASGFPPLEKSKWVTGDEERLAKLILKGLHGPIEVLGESYPGQVPMTPFEGLMDDREIASVMTYIRNTFGNEAGVVSPDLVSKVRSEIEDKVGFYSPTELLTEHPMED